LLGDWSVQAPESYLFLQFWRVAVVLHKVAQYRLYLVSKARPQHLELISAVWCEILWLVFLLLTLLYLWYMYCSAALG
jgi:hypothetical protein